MLPILHAMNKRKIPAQRGLRWHVSSVANLLARAQKLEAARQLRFYRGELLVREFRRCDGAPRDWET